MDEEDIEDQSSLFAIGLVHYYKKIEKEQKSLSTKKTVI